MQAVKDVTAPEFAGWEGNTRLGPYYTNAEFPGHYEFGMLSPYGEQVAVPFRARLTVRTLSFFRCGCWSSI